MTDEHRIDQPHWHAGWNMPGYLPEMDVATFLDHESAKAFLTDALERAADGYFGDDGYDEIANELSTEQVSLGEIIDGEEWTTFPIDHTVYWLTFCGESHEIDSDTADSLGI